MLNQHRIGETLSNSAAIASLEVLLAQAGHVSRTAFARQVCCEFDVLDSRGNRSWRIATSSCAICTAKAGVTCADAMYRL